MNNKIIAMMLVLVFSICCLNVAFADDNATDALKEDMSNYIMPISISDDGIKFSDGYTGFCLDADKDKITTSDGFIPEETSNDETENQVKLAIIECYKQNRVDDIAKIVESLISGNYDSSDDIIKEVLASDEKVGGIEVVEINNTTQGTFDFELLKSADENKSDCLAFTVSLETVESEEPAADEAAQNNTTETETVSDESAVENQSADNPSEKTEPAKNATESDKKAAEKEPAKKAAEKTEPVKNATDKTAEKAVALKNKTEEKAKTIVNETNRTIVNKTNTLIVNENNTTIVNNNNVKTVGEANEVPQSDNGQNLLRAGNAIPILIIVAAIVAVAAVVLYRKD